MDKIFTEKQINPQEGEYEQSGKIYLDEFLDYAIDSKNPYTIEIRVKSPSVKGAETIRKSLDLLAEKLQNDSTLKDMTTIFTFSWIVFQYPGIFKKLGFTILEMSEEDKVVHRQRAEISREKFIERPWRKKSIKNE